VRNTSGQLVPMSSIATVHWSVGPSQIVGFNYYPSVRFSGSAKAGYTSGDAIREMERLAARLPKGFGYEWAGQSLQEKLSGSQAPFLLMLSVLLVFLVLAALYESWTIPLSVLLTVEGYRLRRELAHGRPGGGERKQRHRKQMREIEPQQAWRSLIGVAHQVVVIGPDDGDEEVTHRVAQPRRPESQQRLERGPLGRSQFQHQHGDEHREYAVGERAQSLRCRRT
jgi:hypothetical protein